MTVRWTRWLVKHCKNSCQFIAKSPSKTVNILNMWCCMLMQLYVGDVHGPEDASDALWCCVLMQLYVGDVHGPEDASDALCIHCANGTQGSFCDECKNGYFRLKGQPLTEPCQMWVSLTHFVALFYLLCPVTLPTIFTHAGYIAAVVSSAFSRLSVCLFVCALKGKRPELSTPNLVHIYSIAVARHALTQRSNGQRSRSHGYENRHGRTVASDACCYGRVLLLPACRYDCLCFLVKFMYWCYISVRCIPQREVVS